MKKQDNQNFQINPPEYFSNVNNLRELHNKRELKNRKQQSKQMVPYRENR